MDLAAWQGFYRENSNDLAAANPETHPATPGQPAQDAFQKRYGARPAPLTNYFPVAKQLQAPAADVLLALSKFNENRRLLIAAAARPQARFWVNYDAGYAMLLPHLARLKSTAQYLALHAAAALKAGDRETALEDVKLSFRLMEAIRPEPSLLSHLVRVAMVQIGLMLLPALTSLAEKCARAQACVDLARIACALERYRLANGQFPEALEALAPNFITSVPHDIINGQPLKYRRTDDGQFVLYSVGWNETDDGGNIGLKESGRPDDNAGDWVWRYPVK